MPNASQVQAYLLGFLAILVALQLLVAAVGAFVKDVAPDSPAVDFCVAFGLNLKKVVDVLLSLVSPTAKARLLAQRAAARLPALVVQKPSIGRVVHFVPSDDEPLAHYPAIILRTTSDSDRVDLVVFGMGAGATPWEKVPFAEKGEDGVLPSYTWHWPERV